MISKKRTSLFYPLIASFSLLVCFSVSKKVLFKIPWTSFLFFWFLFRAFFRATPLLNQPTFSFKTPFFSLHLFLGFIHLGIYASLFGALLYLPLLSTLAFYLMFPLFIPWVLRIWMGKKYPSKALFGAYLALLGAFFFFLSPFQWNLIALFLALLASLLKAIHWVGHRQLRMSALPFTIWFYEQTTTLLASALLLIASTQPFNPIWLLFVLLAAFFEFLMQKALSQQTKPPLKLYQKAVLFNTSIFLGGAVDELIFHNPLPLKILTFALLIYLSLSLLFLQKNILPNPIYDL